MTYEEALDYIHGSHKLGWKLGLHNITKLLDLMDNPHKKLKCVHVAGTNGKGSTVAFISNILIEAGYKVGIYTSPYLERFTERIKVNHSEIGKEELARLTSFVKQKVDAMLQMGENHPTEFEIITAIAFQYYCEQKCDVVVLEVGLGGRFDATNVINDSLVSVITTINFDHMQWLGNTLPGIAFEKAGIIKQNGDVVIFPQPDDVMKVFRQVCDERGARLHVVDFAGIRLLKFDIDGQVFDFNELKGLEISLLGKHQLKNAATAVQACQILCQKGFNITVDSIRQGLKKARWPGRMEVLRKNPVILIDGAHNAEGAKALRNALTEYFPNKRIIFIMGVVKDKDYKSMIEEILPIADSFITVTPNSERALSANELAIMLRNYCKNVLISDTIEDAVKASLDMSRSEDVICAFGSLFYIGAVRSLLV